MMYQVIILINHQELGVCTTDICGNPALPSRTELSFTLPCCSASSHSSLRQGKISKLALSGTYEVHLKMQGMFANGWGNSVWHSCCLV